MSATFLLPIGLLLLFAGDSGASEPGTAPEEPAAAPAPQPASGESTTGAETGGKPVPDSESASDSTEEGLPPIRTDVDRSTPETLLATYLQVWENKDLAAYGELLHPGFQYVALADKDTERPWSKGRELEVAEQVFSPRTPDWDFELVSMERRDSEIVPGGVELQCDLDLVSTREGVSKERKLRMSFHVIPDADELWVVRVAQELKRTE